MQKNTALTLACRCLLNSYGLYSYGLYSYGLDLGVPLPAKEWDMLGNGRTGRNDATVLVKNPFSMAAKAIRSIRAETFYGPI